MDSLIRQENMRVNFGKSQSVPEMGLGTTGSMHHARDGYGFGALPVEMLQADKAAHHSFKDDFRTSQEFNYDAIYENANTRDRRRARLVRKTPRMENLVTSNGDLGSFDSARKNLFTPDKKLMRVSKKAGKSLSAAPASARAENWFCTSADYGSLRRGERASQPHQEPSEACLPTDRRHPCKTFKKPIIMHHHKKSRRDRSKFTKTEYGSSSGGIPTSYRSNR